MKEGDRFVNWGVGLKRWPLSESEKRWSLWEVSNGRKVCRKKSATRTEYLSWIGAHEQCERLARMEALHRELDRAGIDHHFEPDNHHITESKGESAPFVLTPAQAEKLLQLFGGRREAA